MNRQEIIINDVKRVIGEMGKPEISEREYIENGGMFTKKQIAEVFGVWYNVEDIIKPKAKGSKPRKKISDEQLIEDLKAVADTVGDDTVLLEEYENHGKYYYNAYKRRFGNWSESLKAAGLKPVSSRKDIDQIRREIAADIRQVAKDMGKKQISISDYNRNSKKYSMATINYRFKNWGEALELAGLERLDKGRPRVTEEEVWEDVVRVAKEWGTASTAYDKYGKYAKMTVLKNFGTWKEIKEKLAEEGLTKSSNHK